MVLILRRMEVDERLIKRQTVCSRCKIERPTQRKGTQHNAGDEKKNLIYFHDGNGCKKGEAPFESVFALVRFPSPSFSK